MLLLLLLLHLLSHLHLPRRNDLFVPHKKYAPETMIFQAIILSPYLTPQHYAVVNLLGNDMYICVKFKGM